MFKFPLFIVTCLITVIASSQNITGTLNYCQGGNTILTVSGAPAGSTFQWQKSIDGGTTWTNITGATLITYSVNAPASYTVIVTTGSTTNTLIPVVVTEYPRPTASFTFNPNNACAKSNVQFTNTSTGSGLTYQWDFNDPGSGTNNTSTSINPSHSFIGTVGNGTQNFTVKLITTSVDGCRDSTTSVVTIKQRPDTQLGGTGSTTYNGLPYFRVCSSSPASNFTFTNQSTTTSSNTNYTFIWGDNTPNTSQSSFTSVTHTYPIGTHTLLFIVSGSNACVDTGRYYVFVGSNPAVGLGNPGNTSICTQSSLTFPITGSSTNSPGTNYTVTFNDGTPSLTFSHPPPDSVSHIFNLRSCGTNSLNYNNSFSASINASNPCGSSSGFVVPIYVSTKPNASFTIGPKDTVCVNNIVTFTSNGNSGNSIENGSCLQGKLIWSVSPSTGWIISSGLLGNDFSLNDPSVWITGTSPLRINFTTPGVYTIKLKVGANSFCGIDSIVKTICVNTLPVAAFDVNNNIGCSPLIVTTTNNSSISNCGQNKFSWTVSYSPTNGCSPNTSGYTYINGTNSTSAAPEFQFTNPGIYTISLTTIAPASACSSVVVSKQITVKGKPVVNMNVPASICLNQSLTPTSTSTCNLTGVTYNWAFTGGTPSSSNLQNPGTVSYTTPGIYTVTLNVTNECGTTTVSQQLTVKDQPATPTIGSNSPLCTGGTLNLTSSVAPAGVTYLWTGPGGYTSNIQNPIRTNVTAAMGGPYTLILSLNGCSSPPVSVNVVINTSPGIPTVITPVNYCQGATATALSATAAPGNSLLWYTIATGGTGSATAPIPSTATVGTTTYYVSQLNSNGTCESARVPIVVNVFAVPSINGSFQNPTTCSANNGSITITGLTPNTTYTVKYVKNGGPVVTLTLTANASGVITITNLSAGTYTNINVTLNGCISNILGPFALVDPSPPPSPTIGSNSPLCSGATLNLTSTAAPAGATYAWTGPGGFTSNSQNPIRNNVTVAVGGTYTLVVTLNGCSSAPVSTNVVINLTPAAPVVITPINYCEGATATPLTATPSAGNTLQWYTTATGGTGSSTAPVPPTAAVGTTTYYVSQVNPNGNCESVRTSIVVNVYDVPVINGTFQNPTTCSSNNGSISITGLTPNTSYTVKYVKNSGPVVTLTLISNASGVITINNLSAGTYTNISVTLNGCTSNILGPFMLVDPSPPPSPTISSNSPLCSGATLNLTSSVAPAGATYSWTGPLSFTSNIQNPVRTNVTTPMAGTYSLIVTQNGCSSAPVSINVVINATPTTPVVTTPVNYCQEATATALNATATAGNSLLWYTTASGGTGNSTAPVPSTTTVGTTTYYVSQINAGATCESSRASIVVNVYAVPSITGSFQNPATCLSNNGSITLTGLTPNITYSVQYVRNGGAPITLNLASNASGVITINNLSTGTYTNISVSLNSCTSNIIGPFVLVDPSPPPTPTIGSNSPLCSGASLNLTSTAGPAGSTYAWTGPGGYTSNLQNPVRTNVTTAMNGAYTLILTLNGCPSPPATVNVVINSTPSSPGVNSPVNYCQGATATPLNATATAGNTLLWYTTSTGGTGNTTAPIPSTVAPGSTTFYVSEVNPNGNCESSRAAIVVNVYAVPSINGTLQNPVTCLSNTGTILITGVTANASYGVQYTRNGGAPITLTLTSNSSGVITINNLSAGTYDNITVTLNGCTSNIIGPFILVDPLPPSSSTVGSNSPLCSGATLNLTSTAAPAGATYAWTGPGGYTSTIQNPVRTNVTPVMSGAYNLVVTLNGCSSTPASVNVVISPTPSAPVVSSPVNYCQGATATALNATASAGNTLLWYTSPTGGTGSSTAPVPSTATAGSSTYYVSQVNPTGNCEGGRVAIIVNVSPVAIITGTFTNPTTCISSDGTIKLTGLIPNTIYSIQYTLNGGLPTTISLTSSTNGIIILSNLPSGSYTNITASINGCPSNSVGPFILMDPSTPPTPVVINNSPLCPGGTLLLTASNVAPGAIYSWTGPAGFTSSLANPIRLNVTPSMSGSYSLIVTQNSCPSNAGTTTVNVAEFPIVSLGPDLTLPYGTQQTLNSIVQNGPISNYAWTPSTRLTCSNCPSPIANVTSSISYILKATNIYGCSGVDTINIKVNCDGNNVFIPNAFSPDGDGVNDVVIIRAAAPITIKYFRIFNRWGELVFEKINFPPNSSTYGWDGKVNGKVGGPDVYVYTAEVVCDNGSSFIYKGNISLLK